MRAWLALLAAISAAFAVGCGGNNEQSPAVTASSPGTCSGYYGLTFSSGPNTTYTPKIKAALDSLGVKATFFMTGRKVSAAPELAKAVVDAGNWVGNQTYTHPKLTELSVAQVRNQLTRTNRAIEDATGVRPQFVRAPYGEFDDRTLRVFRELNLENVIWNVDPKDFQDKPVNEIVADAVKVPASGIIVLHDSNARTVAALPQIVNQLKQKGLCPGKLMASSKPVEALPDWPGRFSSVVAVRP